MRYSKITLVLYFSMYVLAAMLGTEAENSLFNGREIILATASIGLLLGFSIYRRKDPQRIYARFEDDRAFLRRQTPDLYACFCIVFISTICFSTSKGDSFEVLVPVVDKYKSLWSRNPAYVLDLEDNALGTLRRLTSKQEWLQQQQGNLVLLEVRENILGFHLVVESEVLEQ
ncbi:hypothetical protein KP803_13305 [Vibrio sp. ZSDE26]|uniref:Uncharacterized protein n=1 Tax=Vibrio amylolyticus TaxID=2847292 RepID=A0A9X1XJ89_9VIBR|nr:hypothetical protein [Vibrio amylolyticus]MCK6264252.1 hypothetical protein [Vibrio amylolyticus]